MLEVYKIKIIRKDTNTQYKKKVYETTEKFVKYGTEMFKRHHNVKFYNSLETYCEIYKLTNDGYEKIDIPKEFLNGEV